MYAQQSQHESEHQKDTGHDQDPNERGQAPAPPLNLAQDPGQKREIAARGVRGHGQPVPHADAIEASTGRSTEGVEAFVGGEAAEACEALGAEGYALGNKVAFKEDPDPELAAHEVEHTFLSRLERKGQNDDGPAPRDRREAQNMTRYKLGTSQ